MKNARGSLVPTTLRQMEEDKEFIMAANQLKQFGQAGLTKEEKKRRQRALRERGFPDFRDFLTNNSLDRITKGAISTLQVNVGLYCNQACSHCHVESSPRRKEQMTREVADRCLVLLAGSPETTTLDITGGAPELCNEFRYLVENATKANKTVIVRSNLTALLEPGQEETAKFMADHHVQIVASLPCYSAKNVNLQRGKGVFEKSIAALLQLNELGYGRRDSLQLHLVYNPLGAFLPPDQAALEAKYREELWEQFGIEFTHLFALTNMPIKRFADFLLRRGELADYMELLVRNFNPATLDTLMCRSLASVNYDGRLFDCDFNQQLDLTILGSSSHHNTRPTTNTTVFQLGSLGELRGQEVAADSHCFGCTAGRGSS